MEKISLTIPPPPPMKDFIGKKVQGVRFSTPSEHIRSLIRDNWEIKSGGGIAAAVRRLRTTTLRCAGKTSSVT
jgi:hypothetical protein